MIKTLGSAAPRGNEYSKHNPLFNPGWRGWGQSHNCINPLSLIVQTDQTTLKGLSSYEELSLYRKFLIHSSVELVGRTAAPVYWKNWAKP